ncbi:ComF family protein [Aurantiacibacter spongiae]|uniref:ComF family protein n=1 Tax=Aurantiacibacter spongiae TaxID=2488860 RepID=A0A3N5D730_9SPHN|nr:ComF family protein [Aurantiacibacter spongiae]RPF70308.1 ComF family protein [Aurantiacibacter spongiae]
MTVARTLSQSLAPLVDLVYPPRCPVCGDGIGAQTGLCLECWNSLAVPGEPACSLCQMPASHDEVTPEGAVCRTCRMQRPEHDGIAAATLYNDTARKLVLSFKHGNRIALAPVLARLIVSRLPGVDEDWVAVPVPLHRSRLWRRGYNQSALLAREIARRTGARLCVDALKRLRATPSLGGLDRAGRADVLAGAIALDPRRAGIVSGARVLVVDDVLTSGATSTACVRALKDGGAAKVVIACFSRVLAGGE